MTAQIFSMESSNKLHAMGYTSTSEQIENTVDGITTITEPDLETE